MSFAFNHADEQQLSDRTLGRFRVRCNAYAEEKGVDLLHNTITSLSREIRELFKSTF